MQGHREGESGFDLPRSGDGEASFMPEEPGGRAAVGVVVIGRNEGERLRRCLESLRGRFGLVVYVDSGSTDGSLELAKGMGALVVELDLSTPFTAARARNAGFERLLEICPGLEFVQFVDGDCELVEGWIDRALGELRQHPEAVVVCGRRRERFPERSPYNRLCDLEWDTPVGEADACGGDALMRVRPLHEVGGFDAALIAGEEPELCLRLRRRGGRIRRIDAEMSVHDASMTRLRQWWNRSRRAGHAAAENHWMHRRESPAHYRRAVRSAAFWGGLLPLAVLLVALAGLFSSRPGMALAAPLAAAAVLGLMVWRILRSGRRRGWSDRDAALYAWSCMLGKLPEFSGQLLYLRNRLRKRRSSLIEYRERPAPPRP
jgi:GT2 family glycosyltransferase